MNEESPTTADLIIRNIVKLLILAAIGFGLPVALTAGMIEPSSLDYYARTTQIGGGYQINFDLERFFENLISGTVAGIVVWLAPLLITLQVFSRIFKEETSIILISISISIASLMVVTKFPSGHMGVYNYIMVASVAIGTWVATAYLVKRPIRISEV